MRLPRDRNPLLFRRVVFDVPPGTVLRQGSGQTTGGAEEQAPYRRPGQGSWTGWGTVLVAPKSSQSDDEPNRD